MWEYFPLVIFSGIGPFLNKYSSQDLSSREYILLSSCVYTGLFIIWYTLGTRQPNETCSLPKIWAKMSSNSKLVLCCKNIFAVFVSVLYFRLLKRENTSILSGTLDGASLFVTTILGWCVFNQNISINTFLGLLLIIIGILCVNMSVK
uniref:EamA domain-containing protein n=1 Tax=Megaviridae environmental sample TaxID=1737588 RepID=A0A5J6VJQ1_9VIRU|nr:MAG: hypothetical protein [Megaviridae environmental sample]